MVRLRWLVVPAWAAAAVASVLWLPSMTEARESSLSGLVPENAEAIQVDLRSAQLFGIPLVTHTALVQRDPKGLSRKAQERVVARAVALTRGVDPRFREIKYALPVLNTDRLVPGSREDGTTAITYLFFDPRTSIAREDFLAREYAAFELHRPGDSLAGVTGAVPARLQEWRSISGALAWVELASLGLIALILGVYFRGIGAPLAALATAGVAYLVATHAVAWIGQRAGIAVLTVVASLLVAMTLLPALMAIFGAKLFWPGAVATVRVAEPVVAGVVARLVVRRWVAVLLTVLCLAVLGVACRGLLDLRLGFTLISGLPRDTGAKAAAEAAAEGFAPGILAPTIILVEGPRITSREEAFAHLGRKLGHLHGVAGVVGPANPLAHAVPGAVVAEHAQAVRYLVILSHQPYGADAIDTVSSLRGALPDLLRGAGLPGATAGIGGDTALAEETVTTLTGDIWRIALAALLVNFVLLALFLRAVVAPLYLIAASGLALAASLGLAALIFQDWLGYGDMTYYVPFAVAVLLLSLGSDYNVFVVGRIWQEARRRPLTEAIKVAAPRASRAVAVAGIALAASFATLAIVPLRPFRELAFTMGLGVILDAFVVRSLLVPALISLFGDAGWWPGRPAAAAAAAEE